MIEDHPCDDSQKLRDLIESRISTGGVRPPEQMTLVCHGTDKMCILAKGGKPYWFSPDDVGKEEETVRKAKASKAFKEGTRDEWLT